ncbi:SIR2 family protein, partial [bacterium]|nr:SIR2 family protein [bacterium]
LNCAAIGPKKAIIKGLLGEWRKSKSEALLDAFWDSEQEHLKLGDFRELVKFLLASSGKQEIIEAKIKETNED